MRPMNVDHRPSNFRGVTATRDVFTVSKSCKALEKVTVSKGVSLPFSASESLFNGSDKSKISLTSVANL